MLSFIIELRQKKKKNSNKRVSYEPTKETIHNHEKQFCPFIVLTAWNKQPVRWDKKGEKLQIKAGSFISV